VLYLRKEGWDVLHAYEIGLSRASDRQIVENARRDGCNVVTLDADFHALLAVETADGPSGIRIRREGLTGADLAGLLVQLWPTVEQPVRQGAMVTVTDTNIRVRRLPISRTAK
jgi:predicted nuclease of predicted toxin-antitoxin system